MSELYRKSHFTGYFCKAQTVSVIEQVDRQPRWLLWLVFPEESTVESDWGAGSTGKSGKTTKDKKREPTRRKAISRPKTLWNFLYQHTLENNWLKRQKAPSNVECSDCEWRLSSALILLQPWVVMRNSQVRRCQERQPHPAEENTLSASSCGRKS